MLEFMKSAIESHCLAEMTPWQAKSFAPHESYWKAKELAADTDYFERKDIIVSDDNYSYPPAESFVKSFERWLALQEHDVRAVVSLHEWRKSVGYAQCKMLDNNENADETEKYRQLEQLRDRLSETIDRIRKNKTIQQRKTA